MSKIFDILTKHTSQSLYPDTVVEKYQEDVVAKKIKHWSDLDTYKEREKARKELIIKRSKIDRMPALKEKLEKLYGELLFDFYEKAVLLNECSYRMNKLHKLQNKKNFTYEDTYKVDDLFKDEAPLRKRLKIEKEITEQKVLGYIEKAIENKNKEFLEQVILSMRLGGVSIHEKK